MDGGFAMYIDPNTGGMLFQVLAVLFGLFSGMILFFSGKIRQVLGRFRRATRKDPAPSEADDIENED
jgi:hypothetical protein